MINQLFEEITEEYSLQILKWAYKKCGDGHRAEELTQEVMLQIFSAIQKNREAGKTIEELTAFYQAKLPKQLKPISKLPLKQALYDMAYVTTFIAFRDGMLYVPKDSADGEFLTMLYVDSEQ